MSKPKSKAMRIAIVIENYNPHAGGLERSTAQIAQELAKRGHAVTMLAGGCKDTSCLPSVTIKAMGRRKARGVIGLYRFEKWARQQIEAGGLDTTLSVTTAVPARVLQPRGGTVRETLDRNIAMRPTPIARLAKRIAVMLNPKQQLLLKFERRALNDPGLFKVAAVSHYVTRQLQQHYNYPADKVALIPNAAVMPKVDPEKRAEWRKRIRDSFGIADETTVFLFAAINPRLKGYDSLLKALLRFKTIPDAVRVLLAGEFWHKHNEATLKAGGFRDHTTKVWHVDVRNLVCFVRHTRKIEALYAAADVTVHPTFYDPASKVVIESLMMGVPAISTAYNGASDLIEPEDGPARGLVIPDPADYEALDAAMFTMTDPEVRARYREACEGLETGLSMAGHVDQLEALLRESAEK